MVAVVSLSTAEVAVSAARATGGESDMARFETDMGVWTY